MGSMMGNFAANVASTATGVVVGRAIDRTFFGGGSGGGGADAEAPAEGGAAAASAPENASPEYAPNGMYTAPAQSAPAAGACTFELENFRKCLEDNNNDYATCQWNFDALTQCQNAAAENAKFASQ